ncbi:MAG: hypothetical protein HQL82_01900 [Magnetococcales bacterium]|nr:hypothetical protein [Magnetococcales bacterium]
MDGWIDDQKLTEEGGRVWYAVDADVVALFTKPTEIAVGRIDREGYAVVFPGDEADEENKEATIALGHALARHIFSMSREVPLLALPPTRTELRRIYTAVVQEAEEEKYNAQKDLDDLLNIQAALGRIVDQQQCRQWLERNVPAISRLLFGLGTTGQLLRLSHLFREKRLANMSQLVSTPGLPVSLANALRGPVASADVIEFSKVKEKWLHGLVDQYCERTKTKPKDMPQRVLNNFINDAELLAWIQWINHHLAETRQRMVLVTGSVNLFHLTRGTDPHGIFSGTGRSFADLYLRHPKAFLAEPSVLFPSPDAGRQGDGDAPVPKKKRFFDWLETLLSYSKGYREESSRTQLERNAQEALTTQPDLLRDFEKDWAAYRFSVLPTHQISDPALNGNQGVRLPIDTRLFDLFKASQAIDQLRDGIRSLVNNQLELNWNACFNIATLAGYGLLSQKGKDEEIPTRNPPPIYFSSLPEASRFITGLPFFKRLIQAREERQPLDSGDFEKALARLRGEDPSGYTFSLGFAQLYAMEGDWIVSNIQAKRAFHIAENSSQELISGREAAYMRAVARRHSAKGMEDLLRVRNHLATARERLERDLRRANPTTTTDLRFQAEELAVSVTAHLFRMFCGHSIPSELEVPPSLVETESLLESLINAMKEKTYASENNLVKLQVEQHLLVNLLMVALLRHRHDPESIHGSDYLPWYQKLNQNIDASGSIIRTTFFVSVIRSTVRWLVGEDRKDRKEAMGELNRLLTDMAIDDRTRSIFPYDKARYRYLRDLVNGKPDR